MRKYQKLIGLITAGFLGWTCCVAQVSNNQNSNKEGDWGKLQLTWKNPDSSKDLGFPIGNGHIGARVINSIETEILTLNDKWFWSGGPGLDGENPQRKIALDQTRKLLASGDIPGAEQTAKGMYGRDDVGSLLPIGKLTITFNKQDSATGFTKSMDLDKAVYTVKYKIGDVTYTRETFASFPDDVIVLRVSSNSKGKINFTVKLSYPEQMAGHGASIANEAGNILVMKGKAPANGGWDEKKGMTFESRLKIIADGGTVNAGQSTIAVTNANSTVLIFANATSYNGFDKEPGTQGVNPEPIVKNTLDQAATKTYDQFIAQHVADYQSLFRRVSVEINGQQSDPHALGFQYARYEMISVSRNGDRPNNQNGMWIQIWRPFGNSAHWLNENVEKHYGLIETANLSECGEPLWNWMKELAINGTRSARNDWGFNGWEVGQCSDIWAKTTLTGLGLKPANFLPGAKVPNTNQYSIWPMGGVWLCQNLYDHYAFTLDTKFLRERAYPILKGAAEFCLDYLVEGKDGYLVTSPSTSPENRFRLTKGGKDYSLCFGSTMDMALIRELFDNTIEAAKILNIDKEFRDKMLSTKAKLLPFRISTLDESKGELQEWSGDYWRTEKEHRHASHLVAVWPLRQITERGTPELFTAAKVAMENRGTGGYHPDKSAMLARLHEGDKAMEGLPTGSELIDQWPPRYAAFPELLVQSHTDAIELLPALPNTWTSGKVIGLRARGNYELSLEWKDGQLTKCRIDSYSGLTPVVRYNGQVIDLKSDSRITLNMAAKPESEQ